MAPRLKKRTPDDFAASVVDLGARRDQRRSELYRERLELALESHRRALTRLFESGLVFTRHGSRVGQELLRARLELLRLNDLAGRGEGDLAALLGEIEARLEKSAAIARRHKELFDLP